ncbi:MAG: hypothetical protein JW781_09650 [Deltaproteobacteria bacterium]|nr:hypothetical protein [Candidatus Anaeroferrophillacea bacterium]
MHRTHPGRKALIVDAAGPISRYPEMAIFADEQVKKHSTIGHVSGHAGNGNLHVVMAGDPQNQDESGRLEAVNHAIVAAAVKAGGTCTGEHGVGIGKGSMTRSYCGGRYGPRSRSATDQMKFARC